MAKTKSSKALVKAVSNAGKAYKKSKIYKADINKVTPPKDYGKRQSKNIEDARDVNGAFFKKVDAKGKLDDKVMSGTSVTDNRSLKKVSSDENTRNSNIGVNGMRSKYPDLVYKRMINPKLKLNPSTIVKKKKK